MFPYVFWLFLDRKFYFGVMNMLSIFLCQLIASQVCMYMYINLHNAICNLQKGCLS